MFTLSHRRFRFYFQTLEPLHLHGYKGSPFRGLFGHSLKKIVCPFKQPDCTPCLLRHQCYYLKLFETPSVVTQDRVPSNGTDHFPHPFILVPPLDQQEILSTGDTFTAEVVLLEVVLPALPYIILAFERMGQVGIGKERNCFQLTHLEVSHGTDWTTVFTAAEGILQLPDPIAVTLTSYPEIIQQVQLTTCTPLRLKQAGHYITKELPFTVLIRRLLRRLDDLSRLYGTGQIAIVKTLLELAETITISDHQLHWIDIRRFSNRQQQHMNLGGLEGNITYTGNLTPFAPWLVWGEILHIGQATSFGFGKYSLKFS
jgi:hypothetical protein